MNWRINWWLLPLLAWVASLQGKPPNFVFVIADDLGWGDVGFHGGSAPTPNLDKLAKGSLELTQHYVAPVCSPTRVGLLTGRCWSRFGVTTPVNTLALPMGTETLPSALKSVGYETFLAGKWHLGSLPQWGPQHFGFDHSYGSLAGGITAWTHLYKNGKYSVTWHRNGKLVEEEGHVTDLLAAETVRWIESRGKNPFFAYVPFTAVHLPVNEPQEWLSKVPPTITSEIGRQYAACIMHMDDAIGQILAALEKKGVRENTVFVFTSDNGGSWATNNTQPYPKDESPPGKIPADNGSFRGQKGEVYEGGTRVPTLVSWPGKVCPGKEGTPVFIGEWMLTFCNLAGYKPAKNLDWDGVDLTPLLRDKTPIPNRQIYIAGIRSRAVSLRSGHWKLVVKSNAKTHEFYNIQADPSEKNNLAGQEPTRLQTLLAELKAMQAKDNDSVVKPQ